MKHISEFLDSEKINKENINKRYDDLFRMVQNDCNDTAAYETHDFSDAKSTYKKGFISILKGDTCFVFIGINSGEDYAKLLLSEEGEFDYLDKMNVGDRYDNRDEIVIRIW